MMISSEGIGIRCSQGSNAARLNRYTFRSSPRRQVNFRILKNKNKRCALFTTARRRSLQFLRTDPQAHPGRMVRKTVPAYALAGRKWLRRRSV